jgi:predicted GNAT superfamily acetyltransferase
MNDDLPALRDAHVGDLPRIVALNDAEIPHVNALDVAVWRGFLAGEARMRVADAPDGTLAALLVALPPGRVYGSENYAWFQRRLADFLYVDRIIVAAAWRGRGLGAALYRDIGALTRAPIVCDINLRPSNDASLAFHGRQGFREIGVHSVYGDTKRVALMARRADGIVEPSLPGPDDGAALRCVGGADGSTSIRAEDADGVVVGMAALRAVGEGAAEFTALRVAEALRGRGLGARLVAAARREAMGRGWRMLEIAVPPDESERRFLVRNGFVAADGRMRLALR